MPYATKSNKSGKTYFLHSTDVTLRGGRHQTIYYFAGAAGKNSITAMPKGYTVIESERTGLPLLKRAA